MYPHINFKIDIIGKKGDKNIRTIWFTFKENLTYEFEIQLDDKGHSCLRPLLKNAIIQKGNKIQIKKGHSLRFFIDFHQEIFLENDVSNNCENYPNNKYESFQECDTAFIRKQLDANGMKNITPIWATEHLEEVTQHVAAEIGEDKESMEFEIFSGFKSSNCPFPCKSTITNTKLITNSNYKNKTVVALTFSEQITIRKTDMVNFNLLTSLSFLGANMGLWLGLGFVQFMEICVQSVCLKRRHCSSHL